MTQSRKFFFDVILTQGAAIGLFTVLVHYLFYSAGWFYSVQSEFIYLFITFLSFLGGYGLTIVRVIRKTGGGAAGVMQHITHCVLTAFLAALIYSAYNYYFNTVIDPDLGLKVNEIKRQYLLETARELADDMRLKTDLLEKAKLIEQAMKEQKKQIVTFSGIFQSVMVQFQLFALIQGSFLGFILNAAYNPKARVENTAPEV